MTAPFGDGHTTVIFIRGTLCVYVYGMGGASYLFLYCGGGGCGSVCLLKVLIIMSCGYQKWLYL